jgi:hypothetical protein
MDVSICADYADRMRHGIIAAAGCKKDGANPYERFGWLSVPLELTKKHDARLVPCLLFLVEESHFLTPEMMMNVVSVLKGIMFFSEDALDAFLEITAVRRVAGTRAELLALSVQIADAINHPDDALMSATSDWLYDRAN